jgi:thiol-disulfide isomerase/thioredoxin
MEKNQKQGITVLHITDNVKTDDPNMVNTLYENHTPIFIKLYADWCGHCKTLAPIWTQLEAEVKSKFGNPSLAIVSIQDAAFPKFKNNAMNDFYKNILADVKGYPTVGVIINKKFIAYEGHREMKDMLEYIGSKVLTKHSNNKNGGGSRQSRGKGKGTGKKGGKIIKRKSQRQSQRSTKNKNKNKARAGASTRTRTRSKSRRRKF